MIQPINDHVLIEPLLHKTFLPSEKGTYEEIGVVIDLPGKEFPYTNIEKGDRVYFDGWLAAKYPKENPKDEDDFYWLVPFKDIRAIEHGKQIPE